MSVINKLEAWLDEEKKQVCVCLKPSEYSETLAQIQRTQQKIDELKAYTFTGRVKRFFSIFADLGSVFK